MPRPNDISPRGHSRQRPTPFTARYPGQCTICNTPWNAGDQIRKHKDAYTHAECTTTLSRQVGRDYETQRIIDAGKKRREPKPTITITDLGA